MQPVSTRSVWPACSSSSCSVPPAWTKQRPSPSMRCMMNPSPPNRPTPMRRWNAMPMETPRAGAEQHAHHAAGLLPAAVAEDGLHADRGGHVHHRAGFRDRALPGIELHLDELHVVAVNLVVDFVCRHSRLVFVSFVKAVRPSWLSDSVRDARRGNLGLLRLRRKVLARVDEAIGLELVLLVVQLAVAAVEREQLLVRAALDDLAGFEHENLVGAADGREAMGDDERGAPRPQ